MWSGDLFKIEMRVACGPCSGRLGVGVGTEQAAHQVAVGSHSSGEEAWLPGAGSREAEIGSFWNHQQ